VARDLLLSRKPDATVTLTRGAGGAFEITVDGRLGFSKLATGQFPTIPEILSTIS
jgi:selT/selW/selH-like putative selenoprotein